ncbi:beta-ketoacyl synthase N-terminal-like domain-containing protein [Clostridium beijerinckii]|uniref:Acyl transferase domain-containing protein/enoyl-CoA hydratase/carnithine racemase n=1 Tax=Clostridium beijerinckii TaxID=1520 RepID=A0AAX0AUV6_CLOBE|nr:beta-ketoacyl synthase N-terminal-like domain-containing protein [Clostridium beijerinckii]NRT86794.1 acyl transferase domain-containing protein/enoyl-CoA hydratase/carnithine racemase [Clostridium beijerinckii]NYC72226.1 acyl transferase domain-containing protein/enoyl-CoA hydratase/carnithine racemase [Clostridium beijerinckii]
MNSKEIFTALQNGEISYENAKKQLNILMSSENIIQDDSSKIKDKNIITVNSVVSLQEITEDIVLVKMEDRKNKNTFSQELVDGLTNAFEIIKENLKYKIAILIGYDTYFASGGSKEGLIAIQEGRVKFTDINIYSIALECPIPVIAAIQGHCIGAGWSMGMFCDFIVMGKECFYSSNYMKYGFTPGAGATLIFPERFGRNLAQEILYTGKSFRGSDLEEKGISFPVILRREVLSYAINLAKELAESSRTSLVALKELMVKSIKEKLISTYESELKMHEKTFVNNDDVRNKIESLFITSSKDNDNKQNISDKSNSESRGNEVNLHENKDLKNAIAIIGMAGEFPNSNNVDEFWENILRGNDCISEVPESRWSVEKYYDSDPKSSKKSNSKWMGLLENADKFDPLFFNISPAEAELMDPQQRVFLESCWHCIEDAGLKPSALSKSRCGVFVGCASGNYLRYIDDDKLNAQSFMGSALSILSARISYYLNLKGPSMAIDTACSSSLVAIAEACDSLILHNCDLALAGGVCVLVGPLMHIMTSKAGMLSKSGRCYTFDQRADGFVPGEGTGTVLLKRLEDAIRDKDNIQGVIRGWGMNQDGKTNGITAPSGKSQSELETYVYDKFNINPERISLIETHGTATKLGDPIEVEALLETFKKYTSKESYCALGSVKSNIGHLLTASGIASVIKVLLSLKYKKLPPTINFKELNEHIDLGNSPFYINNKLREWKNDGNTSRCAAISAFGFSGTNAHLVIEEYNSEAYKKGNEKYTDSLAFILSAKNEESLREYARSIKNYICKNKEVNLIDLIYTLQVGREDMNYRMGFMTNSIDDTLKKLNDFINDFSNEDILKSIVKKSQKNDNGLNDYRFNAKNSFEHALQLWINGKTVEWDNLYNKIEAKRISIPGYPFMRESYWVSNVNESSNSIESSRETYNIDYENLERNNEQAFTVSYLTNVLSTILKIDPKKIEEDTSFDELGIDSIVIIKISEIFSEKFKNISSTLLFTYKDIKSLAEYFLKEHKETLRKLMNDKNITKIESDFVEVNTVDNKKSTEEIIDKNCFNEVNKDSDIAIIGISGSYPEAEDVNEFWNNLKQGKDCIVEIPKERWDFRKYYDEDKNTDGKSGGMYCKWGGFLKDVDKFDNSFFNISPFEARFMDPQERLFLQTAASCFQDAGLSKKALYNSESKDGSASVGVFVGVTYNNYQLNAIQKFEEGKFIPINSQTYSIANRVSYFFNLNGPSVSLDTACSSSLYAIHLACESIKSGECNMAIAGGVNLSLHPSKYISLCEGKFLASDGRCHTFGDNGDGYVPGEGVGAVLLKPLKCAQKDGDNIYAVIKGSAVNNDGKTFGYRVPNPVAQQDVIKTAIEKANVNPETISYVEAHGTGTKLGDPIEIEGLNNAFKQYTTTKQFCAIGSVKSNIGHLESAAGIAQLTKVILQMKNRKLVPSLTHSESLNPKINFEDTVFFVQKTLEDWKSPVINIDGKETIIPRRAGISSFGAGGVNVHLILEEYGDKSNDLIEEGNEKNIITLSAKTEDNLRCYAQNLTEYLKDNSNDIRFSDMAYTLQVGRNPMEVRLAFTACSVEETIKMLELFINNKKEDSIYFNKKELIKDNNNEFSCNENLEVTADIWVKGYDGFDWNELYNNHKPSRISLPTYCFSKNRYWIDYQKDSLLDEEIIYEEEQVIQKDIVKKEVHEKDTLILKELRNALEDERQILIEKYLQDKVACILEFTPPNLPDFTTGFFEMGMESVMLERLFVLVNNDLKVDITETEILDNSSIRQLAKYLLSIMSFDDKDNDITDSSNIDSLYLQEAADTLRNLLLGL